MTGFHVTADAKSDLIGIRRFTLERWGHQQSQKYLSELRQTFRLLAETPTLGRSRPDVGSDIYSFPHASHVVYYTMHEHPLLVFAVLHKRSVPLHHLAGRGGFK